MRADAASGQFGIQAHIELALRTGVGWQTLARHAALSGRIALAVEIARFAERHRSLWRKRAANHAMQNAGCALAQETDFLICRATTAVLRA